MKSFEFKISPRESQYGRYASAMLRMLQQAVTMREAKGESRQAIAERIGMHRSALSRALNGRTNNLTIRTISDILYATGHEPKDPQATAWEILSSNGWTREGLTVGSTISPAVILPQVKHFSVMTNTGGHSTSALPESPTLSGKPFIRKVDRVLTTAAS